jgi:carbon storage regulator
MLILTRRPNQRLVMVTPSGEKITVEVLGNHGSQVKLGVDAPPQTSVDREEIYDRKQADKRSRR